jgi:hypothetical protein
MEGVVRVLSILKEKPNAITFYHCLGARLKGRYRHTAGQTATVFFCATVANSSYVDSNY